MSGPATGVATGAAVGVRLEKVEPDCVVRDLLDPAQDAVKLHVEPQVVGAVPVSGRAVRRYLEFRGYITVPDAVDGHRSPLPTPPPPPANLANSTVTDSTAAVLGRTIRRLFGNRVCILYRIPAVQPELVVLVSDTGSVDTSYMVRGLALGATYEFAIAALGPDGTFEYSNRVMVTTLLPADDGGGMLAPPPTLPPLQLGAPRIYR